MGTRETRFPRGLCSRCGNPRGKENTPVWCADCTTKERLTHTLKLLQAM